MGNDKTLTLGVLGGGGEIGANCYQLGVNGHSILLDSGTHPKREGMGALPEYGLLGKAPDVCLISHGHQDHCGSLPYLLRQFPAVRTFATIPTARIMDRMLHNSVAVMGLIAKERGVAEYPLYEHEDVNYAMRSVTGQPFGEPLLLPIDTDVEVHFLRAGHVLGGASVLIKSHGHSVLYTGDFCEVDQELLPGCETLDSDLHADTLVIESTHGATDENSLNAYSDECYRLGEAIAPVVRNGGAVLLPSFALGRTQEILNIVSRLQEEGVVPPVPVYASGLGRAVYELYDRFSDYLHENADLRPLEQFHRIGNVWEPTVVQNLISQPCIMVATSGMMLQNTPSAMIACEMVRHTHHGIFFMGYLDPDTLGYGLLHGKVGDRHQFALGQPKVECRLANIRSFSFSAHARRDTLQRFIRQVSPKNVVFVHGDEDAIGWMRDNTSHGFRCYSPSVGQTISLEL